jgi:hypothetical protein
VINPRLLGLTPGDGFDQPNRETPTMNTHVNPPEKPQDAFYIPTDISPDELFDALGRLRKEAEDEIERLIGFLDRTDCYEATTTSPRWLDRFGDRYDDELEEAADDIACDDNELDADWSDDEPSLGSREAHPNGYSSMNDSASQEHWADGNTDEREGDDGFDDREDLCEDEGAEHDGREPDVDDEDSLGWTVDGVHGLSGDREAGGELSVAEVDAARRRKESGTSRTANIELDYRSYGPPCIRKTDGKLLGSERRVLR